jgi:hypothetical protein
MLFQFKEASDFKTAQNRWDRIILDFVYRLMF